MAQLFNCQLQPSLKSSLPWRTRLLAPIATLLILLSSSAKVEANHFIRGDVNLDGFVTIADVSRLIRATSLGDSSIQITCADSADIDDNGTVEFLDAVQLITFLFGADGAGALPQPYPQPGTDQTADSLPNCTGVHSPCQGPNCPTGSEIPHIFFLSQASDDPQDLMLGAGGPPTAIPIRMTSLDPVEGFTLSLIFDPQQVSSIEIDFEEGVAAEYNADLRISHVSSEHPGHVYAYVVMEMFPPFTEEANPAGFELLLGNLLIEVPESVPVGSHVEIGFETLPPIDQEPPMRNEVVQGGGFGARYPITHTRSFQVESPQNLFVRGDVNRDGSVNIGDAIPLLQFLFLNLEHTPICFDACDVNDSGSIDLGDSITLLMTLFQPDLEVYPAAPFPHPSIDPTADSLPCENF